MFRLLFRLFQLFPLRNKTTFVTSFNENIEHLVLTLDHHPDIEQQIVILKKSNVELNFPKKSAYHTLQYNKVIHFFQSIYHLATSRYVIVDNYYGFLAVTNFKQYVTCVQIWHAAGAFKQFGLMDQTNQHRTKRAIKRFKTVYNRFDRIVVGSDQMIPIFKKSFGIEVNRFLTTGIPRTDFFFDDTYKTIAINKLQTDLPMTKDKKVILYAPTYRDGKFHHENLPLDIEALYESFRDEYVLLIRLHPAVKSSLQNKYPDFLYDVSDYFSINYLLLGSDILITDYSSIPFDFSLLNRPMIFFAYDLDEYAESRGLWDNYENIVPGPVVKTTEQLIDTLKQENFDLDKLKTFRNEWNQYSNGQSSRQLIEAIYMSVKSKHQQHI